MKTTLAALVVALVQIPVALAQTTRPDGPGGAPAADSRPRLIIVGIEPAADGDPRDAWTATAIEELLTWRLRRCSSLATSPAQRAYQGRLELASADAPAPDWAFIAAALGATHLITGVCRGDARALAVELTIREPGDGGAAIQVGETKRAPLWDALDRATDAIVARLAPGVPPDDPCRRLRPTESITALEYYARAVAAARTGDALSAVRYSRDATDTDPRFRPALGLQAQFELKSPAGGRARAARALRTILELARAQNDQHDRLNAELALSLIAQSENAPQAALTRAQTALELAGALNDAYGRLAVIGWMADLQLVETGSPDRATTQPAGEDRAALRESIRWQLELIELLSTLNDRLTAIPANTKLAFTYERLGDDAAALAAHRRTLALAAALKSRTHEASAWVYLAQFHRARRHWPEARDAATRGLELADAGSRPAILILLGSTYAGEGDGPQALATYQQAYDAVRGDTDLVQQFTCLREIARLRHESGDLKGAVKALQEAVDLAKILDSRDYDALRTQLDAWRHAAGG